MSAGVWTGGLFRFFRGPRNDTLDDVARQMDQNEQRWRAVEAKLPPKIALSAETEADQERRQARQARENLGRRNIWYRKDETGQSPADRYFGEGGS